MAIDNITAVPEIHFTLERIAAQMDAVDTRAMPGESHSLSGFLIDSIATLDRLIDGHNRQESHDITADDVELLKTSIEDNFYDLKNGIVEANKYFQTEGKFEKQDVLKILLEYADGYHAFTLLCSAGEPATLVETWDKANQGDQVNCPQAVTSHADIKRLLEVSFVPSTSKAAKTSLSRSKLFLEFASGALNMREPSNAHSFVMDPFPTQTAEFGWRMQVKEDFIFSRVPWGSTLVALSYGHTADNDFPAGSQRDLFTASLGYVQPLYRVEVGTLSFEPYISAEVTAGYANNRLNFGDGTVPDAKGSMMLGALGQAGLDFRVDNLGCLSAFGSYAYDKTVAGKPDYQSWGALGGMALTAALPGQNQEE